MVGLPVITTQSGGQAIYVRDGKDGYFLEGEEVNELFKKAYVGVGMFCQSKRDGREREKTL